MASRVILVLVLMLNAVNLVIAAHRGNVVWAVSSASFIVCCVTLLITTRSKP